MADNLRKYKSLYSSTAGTFSTGTGVTITPASVTGLPTDTEITLTFDRVNGAGTSTPTSMERIIGTISGSNFAVRTSPSSGRGADSSTEQVHTSPVVEMIWNAKDWNDMIAWAITEHNQDGTHKTTLVAMLAGSQTFTGAKTFTTGLLKAIDVTSGSGVSTFPTTTDTLVGRATTDTLTNKRITKRITAIASSATPTINTDNCDFVDITALALAITSMTTNLSGTPTNGQTLIIRFKDDGTARAITWGASFEARGVALPTTTVLSKVLTVGFIYDTTTSKWGCVASAQEA